MVRWYNDKLTGPLCCTKRVPYGVVLPKSRKFPRPGNSPVNADTFSIIVPTWSITSPKVKSPMLSFNGLFCKLIGIS